MGTSLGSRLLAADYAEAVSIWSSINPGGPDVRAIDGRTSAASCRAQGERSITVNVATAKSCHDHIRLTVSGEDADILDLGVDVSVLLPPDAARLLRDRLDEALELVS